MILSIAQAAKRNSKQWKTSTISWDELREWCAHPADRKEAGGYVMGALTSGRRMATTVAERSALTLDVDHPESGFLDTFTASLDALALIHTTYSSTPPEPRYRVIIPLAHPVAPDEYTTVARAVMANFGSDQFDPVSARPAQFMWRPAAKHREWYEWREIEGEPLDPDRWLEDFTEDLSGEKVPRTQKANPYEIPGVVGAFNRAYEDAWPELITRYELPYEPEGARWHLVGAKGASGMGEVAPGLVYSHHVHDPAYGHAQNAFDLVRVHRFSELDEDAKPGTPINRLPSVAAMTELAQIDSRVTAEIVGADFDAIDDEDHTDHWKTTLRKNRKGEIADTPFNWDLITANDPVFRQLRFNEINRSVEICGDELPWREVDEHSRSFDRIDRQHLQRLLERDYALKISQASVDMYVNTTSQNRWWNPRAEYLNSLKWDGVPRVEKALPGVAGTPYTRMVARKVFVGAVARTLDPGCKWDHVLILYGAEGLGKTEWINRISRGDNATLGDIKARDTLQVLQRKWILVADEGYSLRKADSDAMKDFLTRREDTYRTPYDPEPRTWPRRCVVWGSTNDEIFLRRQHGNRRFLIVNVCDRVDFGAITEDYVDQLWAEAVALYRAAEPLWLNPEEEAMAAAERERYTEEDSLAGIITAFVDTKVPLAYFGWSSERRLEWLESERLGLSPEKGTEEITSVSTTQLWHEALGQRNVPRRVDLLEIQEVLARMDGWTKVYGRQTSGPYGPQVVFIRTEDSATDLIG